MKNILITICGRAGSKGFANKNLKVFCKKPLAYYSLAVATKFCQTHPEFNTHIALNTDSEPLIELVKKCYGKVHILRRDESLCGDTVPKMAVYKDSLLRMEKEKNLIYDYVLDLDITSPLRTFEDIENIFNIKASRDDLDIVFSVTNSRRNPCFNMVKIVDDHVEKGMPCPTFTARQQAPVFYDVNASLYAMSRDFLAQSDNCIVWNGKIGMSLMMDTGILDIDSEEDFLLMEVIGEHLFSKYPAFKQVQDFIEEK